MQAGGGGRAQVQKSKRGCLLLSPCAVRPLQTLPAPRARSSAGQATRDLAAAPHFGSCRCAAPPPAALPAPRPVAGLACGSAKCQPLACVYLALRPASSGPPSPLCFSASSWMASASFGVEVVARGRIALRWLPLPICGGCVRRTVCGLRAAVRALQVALPRCRWLANGSKAASQLKPAGRRTRRRSSTRRPRRCARAKPVRRLKVERATSRKGSTLARTAHTWLMRPAAADLLA